MQCECLSKPIARNEGGAVLYDRHADLCKLIGYVIEAFGRLFNLHQQQCNVEIACLMTSATKRTMRMPVQANCKKG
eukprot:2314010-Amphidinium_carterae.1